MFFSARGFCMHVFSSNTIYDVAEPKSVDIGLSLVK
jgi:hypothetical protein